MNALPLRLVLLVFALAVLCRAGDEKALTVRERLERALKITNELHEKAESSERVSSHDKFVFPRKSHVAAYFSTRGWEARLSYLRSSGKTDGEPAWPTLEDAPLLRDLLSDKDPCVRTLAASALASLHQPEDVPRIAGQLQDKELGPWRLERALIASAHFPTDKRDADEIDHFLCWERKSVAANATDTLQQMTGVAFAPSAFATWWEKNKDARSCLWYWQMRFRCKMNEVQVWAFALMPRYFDKSFDQQAYNREYKKRLDNVRQEIATELAQLPPEVETKVRLCASYADGASDFEPSEQQLFFGPPKLRISTERLLELLAVKDLWPDIDMERGDYNRLVVRLGLAAETLFKPEHVEKLKAVYDGPRNGLWWDGPAALCIGISRLLGEAKREAWLRDCVRHEKEVFTRAYAAAELVNVGLPGSWDFLKERFFAEREKGAIPDERMSILHALGKAPLTQAKRAALADLTLDKRFESLWTQADWPAAQYRERAVTSINAHAAKQLITSDDLQALVNPARSADAMQSVQQKVRTLSREQ